MNGRPILVIEDDPGLREALEQLFAGQGWPVIAVGTLAEAMANLDPAPHGVMLELSLPDGDGEVILRRISEERLPIRAAVVTATGDKVRLHAALVHNPLYVLCKPLDMTEVSRVFRHRDGLASGLNPIIAEG